MGILFKAGLAVAIVASGTALVKADAFTFTNLPNTTTDFGYLSAASNSDNLLVNLDGPAVIINGANFAAGTTFAAAANGNPGMATGTGTGGVSYALTGPALTAYPSTFASGATDPNVGTLLSKFDYGGNNATETLTVNGLTPGNTAVITVLAAAFGAGATTGREESLVGSQGATLASYEENNGMFSTLSYTAVVPASGTLSFTSTALDTNKDTLHYYGFTVSQTPEPACLGLLALGGMGLVARRRRMA